MGCQLGPVLKNHVRIGISSTRARGFYYYYCYSLCFLMREALSSGSKNGTYCFGVLKMLKIFDRMRIDETNENNVSMASNFQRSHYPVKVTNDTDL